MRKRWFGYLVPLSLACMLPLVGIAMVPDPEPDQGADNVPHREPLTATFSICAFDPDTGETGVAVTTRVTQVGRIVPHVRAGVGAVATQATARIAYGPEILDLLQQGLEPAAAIEKAIEDDPRKEHRQIGVVDAHGHVAAYTGKKCLAYAGSRQGRNYTVQGNLLSGPAVIDAVASAFEATEGTGMPLAERLIRALLAGQRAGGDKRVWRKQSAALLVANPRRTFWDGTHITVNIQVAEHPTPVRELQRQYETIRQELGYRQLTLYRGRDVVQLKRMLHALGYWRPQQPEPEALRGPGLDLYDAETAEAVDQFRRDHNLPVAPDSASRPTGLVDRPFVEALKKAYYEQKRKTTTRANADSTRKNAAQPTNRDK